MQNCFRVSHPRAVTPRVLSTKNSKNVSSRSRRLVVRAKEVEMDIIDKKQKVDIDRLINIVQELQDK